MTTKQYEESEVYKFLRNLWSDKTMLEVLTIMINEISWSFNEDENEILIEGHGLNQVMGWSDINGIYCLNDEDRDFDEINQENRE